MKSPIIRKQRPQAKKVLRTSRYLPSPRTRRLRVRTWRVIFGWCRSLLSCRSLLKNRKNNRILRSRNFLSCFSPTLTGSIAGVIVALKASWVEAKELSQWRRWRQQLVWQHLLVNNEDLSLFNEMTHVSLPLTCRMLSYKASSSYERGSLVYGSRDKLGVIIHSSMDTAFNLVSEETMIKTWRWIGQKDGDTWAKITPYSILFSQDL